MEIAVIKKIPFSPAKLRERFYVDKDGKLRYKVNHGSRKKDDLAGYVRRDGYQKVSLSNSSYYAHRIVYYMYTGEMPDHLDHKDRNRANNCFNNLRPATKRQNMGNSNSHRNASSSYKGVSWHSKLSKWRATIEVAGKHKHLGYFDSEEKAAKAYDQEAMRVYGEFVNLNFEEEKQTNV